LLWSAVFAGSFSAAAVVIPPGGLAVQPSGNDLILSFPTISPDYYRVQTSPDLKQWSSSELGVPGDNTVKSLTVTNAVLGGQGYYRLLVQTPTKLLLPQGTAFGFVGHSCGGIQEQVSAGLDVNTGYPSGVVNLSTSCGGSGRGGGGHVTKYKASVFATWDFTGNVISAIALSNGVTADPTTPTDGFGDAVYNVGANAYLVVPIPGAPNGVTAVQSGDQFQVSWTPTAVNPVALTSSTVTATPVNSSASILTTTVIGLATTGIVSSLEPQTVYQITVVDTTIGGASPASAPISVGTSPATIPPSAPTNVVASWPPSDPSGSTDTITVNWQAADPGNSPIDQYLVTITGSDGAGTFTQTVSGTTLTTYFTVDYIPNWSVTVQAHNAAGWGPVSAVFQLGGL
jgi:hypothetical protein